MPECHVATGGLLSIGKHVAGERPVNRVVGAVADAIEDAEDIQQGKGADEPEELQGRQLVCRLEADGPVVMGAQSHAKGLVLIRPLDEVEPGTIVA